ncbi:hypothetical protein COC69_05735 [Bacillus cereus]|uniref:Major tail protein n=1 Tax=Bacillus cereus TaxID=1396 RepID=A0A9X7CRB6_BACCE|nr:hypothetical protein [Bacillus cereus]PGS81631.1 hypothetical protein COC69_05735 [Bacillus cereus]
MGLPTSGYTKDSSKNFLIDAGTIFKNVTWDDAAGGFTGDLLGATTDGVEVNIETKYRKIDVDGTHHVDVVGLNVLESAQGTIKAKLKELTPENLRLAINGMLKESTEYEGYKEITTKRYLDDSDYVENMAIVGKVTGSDTPIVIIFDNVLITSPLNLQTKDGDEASIELEGQSNASFEQLQAGEFPWRILFPNTGTTETMEVQ